MNKEERFHELLCKSIRGTSTSEEEAELTTLEAERLAEINAEEAPMVNTLDEQIRQLKELLGSIDHF